MSAIGAPSLDYKKFLSDAGSGLVALVSLASVIYICGSNKCCLEFVKLLYEYFRQIFLPLVNNAGISGVVIIISIILFISLMLGFIVNALSYLLLDDLIDQIVDWVYFQRMLEKLSSLSYYDIAKFGDHFKSINNHFNIKEQLLMSKSMCESKFKSKCGFVECLYEIKIRVSIERPDSFRDGREVHGGYIMFRNFVFIILFCLFFIFICFLNLYLIGILFIILILLFGLNYKYPICYPFKYILLAFITPSLIVFLPIVYDPSGYLGRLSHLGFEIIVISIISINMFFLLSAFALTYYHYHIFIAAMYVSLGENWKKSPTLQVKIRNCLAQIIKCISK